MNHQMSRPMMARPARPPTTPPTMAPVLLELLPSSLLDEAPDVELGVIVDDTSNTEVTC